MSSEAGAHLVHMSIAPAGETPSRAHMLAHMQHDATARTGARFGRPESLLRLGIPLVRRVGLEPTTQGL